MIEYVFIFCVVVFGAFLIKDEGLFGFLIILFVTFGMVGGMFYLGTMATDIADDAEQDYSTSNINVTRLMTDDLYCEEIRQLYHNELKNNSSAKISDRMGVI